MADLFHSNSRSARLDQVLHDLLGRAPELLAAAVVSFDGLPMASALPVGMDEDRVAAMSAALLSLGERAAENFGRGTLNQVYVEGENGTVFLVSADDEAVLVAVGAKGAKVGLLMFEVRRSAQTVADALRADDAQMAAAAAPEPVLVMAPALVPEVDGTDETDEADEAAGVYGVDESDETADGVEHVDYVDYVEYEVQVDEVRPRSPPRPLLPSSSRSRPRSPRCTWSRAPGRSTSPSRSPRPLAPVAPEPYQPYATPYAEDLPVTPAPWGSPLTAVAPGDPAPRRDASHWTAYDQTGGEPGAW